MKRDMDLVRQILLEVEKLPVTGGWHEIHLEGRSEDEISYHVHLMDEAGLLEAINLSSFDGVNWCPKHITYVGHDFLDAARNESVWSKAKDIALKATGALTIEGMKLALAAPVRTLQQ